MLLDVDRVLTNSDIYLRCWSTLKQYTVNEGVSADLLNIVFITVLSVKINSSTAVTLAMWALAVA